MKTFVEFILEGKTFIRQDQIITFDVQINLKKDLSKDLGLKYNSKSKDFYAYKKAANIFFDGDSIYFEVGDKHENYDLQFGKSTYGEVKNAVIDMYKKYGDELKNDGWTIPENI